MNITSLIDLAAEQTGQTKEETEATVKAALKIICGVVASGEAVRLPDFGIFEARLGGDPIDGVNVVVFSPAEAFRKAVNHRS
jgi:nucleoid DNA-binding protein